MHRLTVVQLLPALQSGGVERSTLEIAAALVRAGHRAVVVSAGGRLVQPLLEVGAEHLTLDIGRKSLLTLRHVVGLRRLFTELGADIVHARSRLPAWLGWYALRGMPPATRPRFVTTVHGLNSPSRYSAVMTYGERVICVSQTVRDYVCTHYPHTDTARLRVIPRGVEIAHFPRRPQPDRRARTWAQTLVPGLPADVPLLLLPGRGTRLKGHADACSCSPLCVPPVCRPGCGCPARASRGVRPISANWKPRRPGWVWPMPWPSPNPLRASPRPTPPATWCCNSRASPKPSAAP